MSANPGQNQIKDETGAASKQARNYSTSQISVGSRASVHKIGSSPQHHDLNITLADLQKSAERSTRVRGPTDILMLVHYLWFGIIVIIAWGVDWAPLFDLGTLGLYFTSSSAAWNIARIWRALQPDIAAHIYTSLVPYIIFHIFSREAHTILSILWYVSIMTTNLQEGNSSLKGNIVRGSILFFLLHVGCTFIIFYTFASPAEGSYYYVTFLPLSPPFYWGLEVGSQLSLFVLALGIYFLYNFIKDYALNLFDQENDMQRLKMANERLKDEIRQHKNEVQLDTDAPVTKVINILKSIQESPDMEYEVVEALDDAIYVLASNQIYQPNLDFQDDAVDKEINGWLNNLMNYKQPRRPQTSFDNNTISVVVGLQNNTQASMTNILTELEQSALEDFNINSWDFNVFLFADKAQGRPLYVLARKIFEVYNFCSTYNIDETVLLKFFSKVEASYKKNSYHSALHAADVMQSAHYFITAMELGELMTMEDRFAAIIGAACHDIDHPGVNNVFLISTSSPLALRYNDISVLENFHCAKTFEILFNKEENCNIMQNMPMEKLKSVRATLMSAILATDMALHFEYITKFKNKLSGSGFNVEDNKDRQLMIDVMTKCCDISNPTKKSDIARKWTELITEEFYLQGDQERARNLPISMFMDRNNPNLPKCQLGFIDFIVKPLYEPWDSFINQDGLFHGLENIQLNRDYWKKVQEAEAEKMQQQP